MKHINHTITESIAKLIIRWFQFSVVIIALTISMSTQSVAQINFKLGGGFGVMSPASDLSGSTIEYYNGSNYGLSSGLNIHVKGKVGLLGLNLTGEIDYSSLSNSGNSEIGEGKIDISQKILSLKLGPEFRLSLPLLPIVPYIGANLALNSFTGETTFQGVPRVPSATYSVNAATRIGVGFTAGAEVSIGPLLTLDFNLSYNLMNVSGAEWTDVNPEINRRVDSYLSLNDLQDPLYSAGDDSHFVSKARYIHSVLFKVSLLFGL